MTITRRTVLLGTFGGALALPALVTLSDGDPLPGPPRNCALMVHDPGLAMAQDFARTGLAGGALVLASDSDPARLAGQLLQHKAKMVAGITRYEMARALAAALAPAGYDVPVVLQGDAGGCNANASDSRWLPMNRAVVSAGPQWAGVFAAWALDPEGDVEQRPGLRGREDPPRRGGELATGWVFLHS